METNSEDSIHELRIKLNEEAVKKSNLFYMEMQ